MAVELGNLRLQTAHQTIRLLRLQSLVIVTRVVVSSELLPVIRCDRLQRDQRLRGIAVALYSVTAGEERTTRNNGQPAQDGEDAILLADVVGAQTKALLTAEERMVVLLSAEAAVHEIAEELPSRRHLVAANAALLRHNVNGGGGWHRSRTGLCIRDQCCHYRETVSEVGDTGAVCSYHGERVRRRDEKMISENHGSICISVYSSSQHIDTTRSTSKIRDYSIQVNRLSRSIEAHGMHQFLGVCQIRVRMAAPKVLGRERAETTLLALKHSCEDTIRWRPGCRQKWAWHTRSRLR